MSNSACNTNRDESGQSRPNSTAPATTPAVREFPPGWVLTYLVRDRVSNQFVSVEFGLVMDEPLGDPRTGDCWIPIRPIVSVLDRPRLGHRTLIRLDDAISAEAQSASK